MMPIIRPLHIPEASLTEHEKELIAFAEMKADFHMRKGGRVLSGNVFRTLQIVWPSWSKLRPKKPGVAPPSP